MSEQVYPSYNGIALSWLDLECKASIYGGLTLPLVDLKAINWSDSVELGMQRGLNGGRIQKRTRGMYSCESSLTFYVSGWKDFQAELAKKDPRITLVHFDLSLSFSLPDSSLIESVNIKGCRVTGRGQNNAEGGDPTEMEIPINPIEIIENGIRLL